MGGFSAQALVLYSIIDYRAGAAYLLIPSGSGFQPGTLTLITTCIQKKYSTKIAVSVNAWMLFCVTLKKNTRITTPVRLRLLAIKFPNY